MSAQLEDGYTPIAHELLDALAKYRLNGTQANILMFVFRYTYGFHRKCHEMGNSFIAEGTGIHKDQVSREVNKLIECRIIKVFEQSTYNKSKVIGINTNTGDWIVASGQKRPQGTKKSPPDESVPSVGANQSPPPGDGLVPQDIYSFKNNFKDNEVVEEPEVDPYIRVLNTYIELHKKFEWHVKPKEREAMHAVLRTEMPVDFIIRMMRQIHKDKLEANDPVHSFLYYPNIIATAWESQQAAQQVSATTDTVVIRPNKPQWKGNKGGYNNRQKPEHMPDQPKGPEVDDTFIRKNLDRVHLLDKKAPPTEAEYQAAIDKVRGKVGAS